MNVVSSKWVFKIKKNERGEVKRYKARLVARGFTQEYGVDYLETFAPVLKYKSLRLMLALSATTTRKITQLDIKTAFLNADVQEDIYMQAPEGMSVNSDEVLKLKKALYGIKQAPREWNININHYLISIGFCPCVKDPCIYTKASKTNNIIMLGLFVDDIMVSYERKMSMSGSQSRASSKRSMILPTKETYITCSAWQSRRTTAQSTSINTHTYKTNSSNSE